MIAFCNNLVFWKSQQRSVFICCRTGTSTII
jgi:hypothetical protein